MARDVSQFAAFVRDRLVVQGVAEYEVFLQNKVGVSLEVLKGKRENFELKNSLGFGVRVLDGGRLGFSYGSDFSETAVDFVITQALASARSKEPDTGIAFVAPCSLPQTPPLCDASLPGVPVADKLALAMAVEAATYEVDKRVVNVRNAAYEDETETTVILNSLGLDLVQTRSLAVLGLTAIAQQDGQSETGGDSQYEVFFKALDPVTVGRNAARDALQALGGRPIPNYKGPVILTNEVAHDLLSVWGVSFRGDAIAKNNSYLIGKKGKAVYASGLTVVDDGLRPNGVGTAAFDGEGHPRQRTVLVENGRVNAFLFDTHWGKRLNEPSTGNSARGSYLAQPVLAASNFFIEQGQGSLDDLIGELGEGVIVTSVLGVHTANAVSGQFSFGMQGVLVRGGEKAGAIRSVALSGNLHELFAKVNRVGADLKFFGRIGSPSLLISHAEISGLSTVS